VKCLNDLPALTLIEKEPVICFIEIQSAGAVVAHLTDADCQLATPAMRQALNQRRKCAPRIGWHALMSTSGVWNFACQARRAHIRALFRDLRVGSRTIFRKEAHNYG
jgi:hypothetical protein